MSEQPVGGPDRHQAGADLVLPAAAVLFTIYYFTTIQDVPWTAQVSALFVGSILIVLCAIFAVVTFVKVRRGQQTLGFDRLIAPRAYLGKRLTLLALTVGYAVVIDWLGFTLTTFVFLVTGMLTLSEGRRLRLILLLSALLSIGGYLLFVVAFNTRFPVGPLGKVIGAAF